MTKFLFFIHLSTFSLFSQEYYGIMKNIGKISENGADIIIYHDNKGVRAYMHIYDNRYDNTSFYLFGRGNKNDKSLQLQSLITSEGSYWDGGVYTLEFLDDRKRVFIDGGRLANPIVLFKNNKDSRRILGEPLKKEDIIVDESYFEVNQGRELKLSEYEKPGFKKQLASLENLIYTKKLSAKAIESFESNPILVATFLFSENGFFSLSTSTLKKYEKNIYKDGNYMIDPNFKGYTYKTCGDDYDPEEDYEGKCKTLNFYRNTSHSGDIVLIEVEIHSTCLDDSCSHEYHQLRLFNNSKVDRNYGGGWHLISHKSGVRCDELRGGGSPPCL